MNDNIRMNTPETSLARRGWVWGLGAAAALAGAGVAAWRWRSEPVAGPVVASFWQERVDLTTGETIALAAWRGRPLLVNFWATWCPPCVEELPMIEAFWREHAGNGIQVLGLAIDQPSAVRRFLQRQALSFPIGLAGLQGTALARGLGNVNGGLPFSVFFGKDGGIWRQKLGQLKAQDLQDWHQSWTA